MMSRNKSIFGILVALIAVVAFSTAPAQAKKLDNPGGGGGGGGGAEVEYRFSVIEIPIDSGRPRPSDANSDGVITVAIGGHEAGYGSAAFARVNRNDRSLISYGFLPEPLFVDPNDGVEKNGGSNAGDVNAAGQIVGSAATYDPNAPVTSSPSRAYLWTDDGTGYSLTALPELPGTTLSGATGINAHGDIVGGVETPDGYRAVIWDAQTHAVTDLNSLVDAPSLGWDLRWAIDINDDGLIIGGGQLGGVDQTFVLDLVSQQISVVPLVAPAHSNVAEEINAQGRIVGSMWDGGGSPWGSNPDFFSAYSWDGLGTDPEFLPSATDNTSVALGQNDSDAIVGVSVIPIDGVLNGDSVATLWERDDLGNIQTTALVDAIPNKPEYRLDFAWDINNDGWIGASGRKRDKGKYTWPTMLLVPNASASPSLATSAIPEPSTLILVVLGVMGVVGVRLPQMKSSN